MKIYRVYNPVATERGTDEVYEEMYDFLLKKGMEFRVDYVSLPDEQWEMRGEKYMKRIKCFILTLDKGDVLMIQLATRNETLITLL